MAQINAPEHVDKKQRPYSQLFDEKTIGRFPVEYHMKLDPEVAPDVRPPRKVPVAR